jgi:esterase/lipase superfamily enzyme
MQKNEFSEKITKNIVMEYLQVADLRDFKSARGYLRDNISYVSPSEFVRVVFDPMILHSAEIRNE